MTSSSHLALKILYFQGYLTGFKIAEEIALPFTGIVDQLLENLKRDKFVEVKTSQMGLGEGAYLYAITGAGSDRAREALERSQYAGPCPVPIQVYSESVLRQAQGRPTVTNRSIQDAVDRTLFSRAVKRFPSFSNAVAAINPIFRRLNDEEEVGFARGCSC
jgi:hypothetical protein